MSLGAAASGWSAGGAPGAPRRWGTAALLLGVGGLTAAAAALARGSPVVAAVPVLLAGLAFVVCTVPLRWSVTGLMFLSLTLDLSSDAMGKWHSPLAVLGDLLRENLDKVFPGSGLKLSGLETATLLLYGVALWRRAVGDDKDTRGQEQTAGVLRGACLVYLAGLAYAVAVGLATGGVMKFAIVQVRPLLMVPALYLLFHLAYRGQRDHETLGRLVIAAACVKAVLAAWVDRFVAPFAMMRKWEYSTNHGDSILFAVAILILVTGVLERPDRRRLARAALFLPVIAWGVYHNHRRLAYVDMVIAGMAIYAISPWAGWKRKVTFATVVAAPVLALYLAVGWANPGSAVFAPVRMLRTVSDAKVDRSTLYREVENYNLVRSIEEAPVLGRGFGHPFSEYIVGDSIARIFELYAYEPHNAVLGLLLYGGLFGFTCMWSIFAVGILLAVRAFRRAAVPEDRSAALVAMSALIVCAVQTWGDHGQFYQQWGIFMAMALVVAGKLAVRTGAWPRGRGPALAAEPAVPGEGWLARQQARLAISGRAPAAGPQALALPRPPQRSAATPAGVPVGRLATPLPFAPASPPAPEEEP